MSKSERREIRLGDETVTATYKRIVTEPVSEDDAAIAELRKSLKGE